MQFNGVIAKVFLIRNANIMVPPRTIFASQPVYLLVFIFDVFGWWIFSFTSEAILVINGFDFAFFFSVSLLRLDFLASSSAFKRFIASGSVKFSQNLF